MSGVTFQQAGDEVLEVLAELLDTHQRRLADAEVKVMILMAFGPVDEDGERVGPALKHQGQPALGVVRSVPLKYRIAGLGDAEVLLDGDAWEEMDEWERLALLDHELEHIDVIYEERPRERDEQQLPGVDDSSKGRPALDSAGRPKLRMRHHDRTFGWFDTIARRHGGASQEVKQARDLVEQTGKLYVGEQLAAKTEVEPPRRRKPPHQGAHR
ncbi:MAG: hypothetical protein HC927_10055 [Deltaproteobacteria bacterium]|nr:hypothetical protein [Deltaproteobacteria bacterium]